jgi:hypothetical protein
MEIPLAKKSVVIVGSSKKSSDPSKTNDFVLASKPTPPFSVASKSPVKSVHWAAPAEKESGWVASSLNTSPAVVALAGATEPPTGTTDGVSASRNTARVPSQNFSGFLTAFSV